MNLKHIREQMAEMRRKYRNYPRGSVEVKIPDTMQALLDENKNYRELLGGERLAYRKQKDRNRLLEDVAESADLFMYCASNYGAQATESTNSGNQLADALAKLQEQK